MGRIRRLLRFVVVIIMTKLWKALRALRPSMIFQVYGNARQRAVYWPSWADKYMPVVFPIGIILLRKGWGLIAATKMPEEEMDSDPSMARQVIEADRTTFPNALTVALAGRLPGFARRAGVELSRPLLTGVKGTTYVVLKSIEETCQRHRLTSTTATVAVVGGAGYVGSAIVDALAACAYRRIFVLDPRADSAHKDERPQVQYSSSPDTIRDVDIIVNLSRRGDDMQSYIPFIREGAIVLDDTHPPMHSAIRNKLIAAGAVLWKVMVQADGLRMIPRLPDFSPNWVPGCLLEAVVIQRAGWRAIEGTQEDFNAVAESTGLAPQLLKHLNDS